MNIHTSEAINGGSTPKGGISSLYLEKCICAFLVASCHTPMGALKGLISPIAMAAVPIFFLISGYFLYSPSEEKSYERVKKSIKKIVPIFLIVQLFYWVWLMPKPWQSPQFVVCRCGSISHRNLILYTSMVPRSHAPRDSRAGSILLREKG